MTIINGNFLILKYDRDIIHKTVVPKSMYNFRFITIFENNALYILYSFVKPLL